MALICTRSPGGGRGRAKHDIVGADEQRLRPARCGSHRMDGQLCVCLVVLLVHLGDGVGRVDHGVDLQRFAWHVAAGVELDRGRGRRHGVEGSDGPTANQCAAMLTIAQKELHRHVHRPDQAVVAHLGRDRDHAACARQTWD